MGLGGAFTAVSDDSSAICYNPAGLVFARSTKETSSYSSYARHHYIAKDAIADGDLSQNSAGLRGYFGGMTKDPLLLSRLPVGFAIYVPDAGEVHQTFDFDSLEIGITNGKYVTTQVDLERRFGLGIAVPFGSYGLGAAVTIINRSEKGTVGSRFVITGTRIFEDDPSKTYLVAQSQNFEKQLWLSKFTFGWLWHPWLDTSLGASIQHTVQLKQDMHRQIEFTYFTITEERSDGSYDAKDAKTQTRKSSYAKEVQQGSFECRFGLSHRLSGDKLMAVDGQYTIPGYGENDPESGLHPVWDVSAGTDLNLTPNIQMGFGVFTIMDSRKDDFNGDQISGESINQIGTAFKTSFTDEQSEYFFGLSVIRGRGRGTPMSADKAPKRIIETTDIELGVGLSSLL